MFPHQLIQTWDKEENQLDHDTSIFQLYQDFGCAVSLWPPPFPPLPLPPTSVSRSVIPRQLLLPLVGLAFTLKPVGKPCSLPGVVRCTASCGNHTTTKKLQFRLISFPPLTISQPTVLDFIFLCVHVSVGGRVNLPVFQIRELFTGMLISRWTVVISGKHNQEV
jgi:hypothetical protein